MGNIVFPPCQREGCTETGHHWRDVDWSIRAHLESTCADPWSPTNRIGCVDTHEPAAIPEPEPDPTEVMDETHPDAIEQAAEAHVLASHTRPVAESDPRVQAWLTVAKHPFFADCYSVDDTLLNAVLAKLDAAHAHTCEPVWSPVSFDEIQSGWMIRSRSDNGFETNWGVAHHQDGDGDWFTEAGVLLTCDRARWTYETTAPEPEPEPDPRVGLLEGVHLREGVVLTRSDAALLLSIADAAAPTNP